MAWRLIMSPAALKDMDRMPRWAAAAVARELEKLAADPTTVDIKKLKGRAEEWRIRVGDWRAIFTFNRIAGAVDVSRVLPRGRAYRE